MSAPLDLGSPAVESGRRCARCGQDDRPLWEPIEDLLICASCVTRAYPGRTIRFGGPLPVVASQLTLL